MGKDLDLIQAVREDDLPAVMKILNKLRGSRSKMMGSAKKLNVNFQDAAGMSALHQAALVGNGDVLNALIDCGATVDIADSKNMRPLHYAAWQGCDAQVELLLRHGSSVNEAAIDGNTPLHLAAEHGQHAVVKKLLDRGATPTLANKQHLTPLDLACEFGRTRVVEMLLDNPQTRSLLDGSPADDTLDNERTTCLHLAARNGHVDIVRLLLEAGVDINRQTLQGTCLHEAAMFGKTDVVALLLACGADVNRLNSYEQTALEVVNKFTASRGARDIKQMLREASSNLRARAVKDYNNIQDPSHISFREGELLTVTEQNPTSGLWKGFRCGAYNGVMTRSGYFPASAVVLIDPLSNEQSSKRKIGVASSSELSRHYRSQKHQNGLKFADSVQQGAPPSPAVKQRSGQTEIVGEDGPQRNNSHHSQLHHSQTQHLAVRLPVNGDTYAGKESPGGGSQVSNASAYQVSCQACNGALTQQQHRLSGQSCESGVSSSSSRQSYHSGSGINGVNGGPPSSSSNGSSSSQGSLDRLEESGYSSTVNVHELLQQGLTDLEVLQAWLASLHLEENCRLFVEAGYDMPTISRMMPEDLTAIGITKPSVRKRLKSEIGRLTIHDGIPEYKPTTIQEWLGLLNMSEYCEILQKQGYTDINSITDVTWEDLEDIGIKKLGHQKKMMLAIDRLRRINGSLRRLSTGCRPPATSSTTCDVADSPLLSGRHVVRPSTAPAVGHDSGVHVVPRTVVVAASSSASSGIYSVSSGLVQQSSGVDGCHNVRHPQKYGASTCTAGSVSSADVVKSTSSFLSDDCSVSGSTPPAFVAGNTPSAVDSSIQHRQPSTSSGTIVRSGHAATATRITLGRGGDCSDGDLTPTNERRTASAVGTTSSTSSAVSSSTHVSTSATTHAAVASRQVAALPKPIPVVAKTSNGGCVVSPVSAASPSTTSVGGEWSVGDIVHTSTPKIDPAQRQPVEAGHSGHQGTSVVGQQPQQQHDTCFSYGTLSRKSANRNKSTVATSGVPVAGGDKPRHYIDVSSALDDLLAVTPSDVQSNQRVQARIHSLHEAPSAVVGYTKLTDDLSDTSSYVGRKGPPVPPVRTASFKSDIRAAMLAADSRLSANGFSSTLGDVKSDSLRNSRIQSTSSVSDTGSRFPIGGDVSASDSLLNEVIERLERGDGYSTMVGGRRNTGTSGPRRLGDWQDSRSSSGSEDSDSGLESRRSESVSSIIEVCAASGGSGSLIDTNTLPFANENVGTIKQRGQSSSSATSNNTPKQASTTSTTSEAAVGGAVHLGTGSVVDEWKSVSPLHTSPSMSSVESETVFNDIDGMLMGLTAELDEMLKLQS